MVRRMETYSARSEPPGRIDSVCAIDRTYVQFSYAPCMQRSLDDDRGPVAACIGTAADIALQAAVCGTRGSASANATVAIALIVS